MNPIDTEEYDADKGKNTFNFKVPTRGYYEFTHNIDGEPYKLVKLMPTWENSTMSEGGEVLSAIDEAIEGLR